MAMAGDPKLLERRPAPAGVLGGQIAAEPIIAYTPIVLRSADGQKYALADGRKS